MLKNTKFKTGSYALGVPVGSSSIGPDSAVIGQTRWSITTNGLEYYNGSSWSKIAHEGAVNIVRDSFTGNSVQTDFPMSMTVTYDSANLTTERNKVLVFVGTVVQQPGTNYTFLANGISGGTDIHFLAAPATSADVSVIHNLGSTIAA